MQIRGFAFHRITRAARVVRRDAIFRQQSELKQTRHGMPLIRR